MSYSSAIGEPSPVIHRSSLVVGRGRTRDADDLSGAPSVMMLHQVVLTSPPSITELAPVTLAVRGEASSATSVASSSGVLKRQVAQMPFERILVAIDGSEASPPPGATTSSCSATAATSCTTTYS